MNNLIQKKVKFKAWDIEKKRLVTIASYEFEEFSGSTTIMWGGDGGNMYHESCTRHRLIPLQFINQYDKERKEVYEGFIVRSETFIGKRSVSDSPWLGWVVFDKHRGTHAIYLGPCMHPLTDVNQQLMREFTIVGNIFENPELVAEVLKPVPPMTTSDITEPFLVMDWARRPPEKQRKAVSIEVYDDVDDFGILPKDLQS